VLKRFFFTLLAFIISSLILFNLLSELAAMFEIWTMGAAERPETSKDYGLSLFLSGVVLLFTLLCSFTISAFIWKDAGTHKP
jgi:ABC-type sulfate transport system permease component